MSDRVDSVRFLVWSGGAVDKAFSSAFENSAFTFRSTGGNAFFELRIDLAEPEYAEEFFQNFLSSWRADMLLQTGSVRRELRLTQIQMQSGRSIFDGPTIEVRIVGEEAEAQHRLRYPWRHEYDGVPLIAALVERYQSYRKGHELLPVVGYLCLSALENAAGGGRNAFCVRYMVSPDVRKRFGDLVSDVGTWEPARKISRDQQFRRLTTAETYWLETTVRLFIDRAGKVATGHSLGEELRLSDLPPI